MWLIWWMACTGEHAGKDSACDLCAGGCEQSAEGNLNGDHIEGGLTYEDPPPMGGDHDPCWAKWGVHTEEVGDEHWVHNLEHGGVVFLYTCPEGCADEIATLTGLVEGYGPTALLSPYAALPVRFAAVSWGHRLLQDCLDTDTMRTFYKEHVDQAPESTTASPSEGCM